MIFNQQCGYAKLVLIDTETCACCAYMCMSRFFLVLAPICVNMTALFSECYAKPKIVPDCIRNALCLKSLNAGESSTIAFPAYQPDTSKYQHTDDKPRR